MKRISPILLIAALAFSTNAMAQSGINTTTPAATLDITARNTTGTTTNVDGLLVPRVDRQRAQSMTAVPVSTLVYINNVATGTATGTAANIDATGYYFFNGTVWAKLTPGANNLYNADGTLAANRTVTQNANTLAFTGTAVNSFSVDGPTFSVDAANNRVGVGSAAPSSTLDLQALNPTGTTTNVEGLLVPRVDRQRAQSMASVPTSTLIYVNNAATGTATGTAANIDATGYYFFNGTVWAKLTPGANNLYNADGTLTANRTVTQNANTLAFTGTAVNSFSVDGSTFSVDAANNRVGIGTTTPNAALQLSNAEANRKIVLFEGFNNDHQFYGLGLNSNLLRYQVSNNAGNHAFFAGASASASTELMRITGAGNVGIGTTTPNAPLQFATNEATRKIVMYDTRNNDNEFYGFGVNTNTLRYQVDLPASNHVFFAGSGATTSTELMRITGTGNVGIGTANPVMRLDVTTTGQTYGIQHTNGTVRLGSYLGTGQNNGYTTAGWFGTISNHPFDLMVNNDFGARLATNGNFGIGTPNPTQRLHVIGNVLVSGTVTQNSDIRLKKDVVDNGYGLKELLSLRTINYRYKDEALGTDKKVGFIAQEVKKAMPELVVTAKDDMKTLSVNYAEMTVVLTKAVQEQQEMLKELQQQLKKQQEEIGELKVQLKSKP